MLSNVIIFALEIVVKKIHGVNPELLFVAVSQIDLTFHLYVDNGLRPLIVRTLTAQTVSTLTPGIPVCFHLILYPIAPGTASQFRSAEDEVILLVNGFVGFVQAAGVANKTDDDHAETFDESTEQDVLICHS